MNRISGIFRRHKLYDDISEEIRLHIEACGTVETRGFESSGVGTATV